MHSISRSPHGILIVGNHASAFRGNRAVCEDLAERLAENGWQVFTASKIKAPIGKLLDMLATTWRHRNQYQCAQVDVFSGRAVVWVEAVCWLLRFLDKPYVLTLHGGKLPSFARRHPRRVRRLLKSAALVTTPTGYLHHEMSEYRSDIRKVPNPLDVQRYSFRPRENPRPRMVWLRAFHSVYNPSLAARVLNELKQDVPEANLKMIGPDKGDGSLSELRAVAARLGLGESIEITGAITKEEVCKCLDAADIFINTTDVDNAPVSITEAMACGLCIVSTDVGGIPYLLEDERTALLVPRDDKTAMANAIRRLLTEPGLAQHLSSNARLKAQEFSWDLVLPQWQQILSEISSANAASSVLTEAVAGSSAPSSN